MSIIFSPPATAPTNYPTGDRRTMRVAGVRVQPTTVPGVFRTAARILAANTLHQGDFVADPFDRVLKTPHADRPMCVAAAIRSAAARDGNPHRMTELSELAIRTLAGRLLVEDCGPYGDDDRAQEFHLASWCDVEGRTTESAVAVLEAAADANEVAA